MVEPSTFLDNASPYLELNNQGQVLRFQLNQPEHRLGREQGWADLLVPEMGWEVVSRRQARLIRTDGGYGILDGDGSQPSRNGILVNHRRVDGLAGCPLRHGLELEIGQDFHNLVRLTYYNPSQASATVVSSRRYLALHQIRQWPVELGRSPGDQYDSMQLEAPTVSRRHAVLTRSPQGQYLLQDNNSANGTFVNGQRIHQRVLLQEGDTIQIGPFTLGLRQDLLELMDRGNQIRLDAHGLVRRVSYQGQERVILNQISLPIEPGQLVALVGGSGAGKSTLMKTLLGIAPVSEGNVYLNGVSLRQNFNLYRSQIGYVPQDDIVHRHLTVEEVLTYACNLRLPPDTDLGQVLGQTLEQVQLEHVRHNPIVTLSGGQRKRVSIGVELLADPKLFFLDEPTSGLDPGLDKEMMNLLRHLADQGRTIVLVTHATANIEVCDRIAFLGRGGHLCYYGPPQEAMGFFQMPAADLKYFADIYIKLDQGKTAQTVVHNVQDWQQRFLRSSQYQTYVAATLSPGNDRAVSTTALPEQANLSPLRQWLLLNQRDWTLVWRDRFSLLLNLFTAPIAIALITLAVGEDQPLAPLEPLEATQGPLALRVLFVFTCASIWVGLSGTVQTIVKEASIYARERLVNLGLFPYLGAKLSIRTALALVQTLLITAVVLVGFESPEPGLMAWPLGLGVTTALTLVANLSLGLMVSAFVTNENQANSALPLLLLPQIIFSGVLFKLTGLSASVSWVMVSRWSIGAYGALVDVNGMVPEPQLDPAGEEIPQPFEPSATYDPTWENLGLNWLVLAVHTGVYLGLTLWRLRRKDVV
jgi:ABC-type multidrug transport system ATPase subunit/pSer/pThr/pTyr-binding forkhead associated (FHA) protein